MKMRLKTVARGMPMMGGKAKKGGMAIMGGRSHRRGGRSPPYYGGRVGKRGKGWFTDALGKLFSWGKKGYDFYKKSPLLQSAVKMGATYAKDKLSQWENEAYKRPTAPEKLDKFLQSKPKTKIKDKATRERLKQHLATYGKSMGEGARSQRIKLYKSFVNMKRGMGKRFGRMLRKTKKGRGGVALNAPLSGPLP